MSLDSLGRRKKPLVKECFGVTSKREVYFGQGTCRSEELTSLKASTGSLEVEGEM